MAQIPEEFERVVVQHFRSKHPAFDPEDPKAWPTPIKALIFPPDSEATLQEIKCAVDPTSENLDKLHQLAQPDDADIIAISDAFVGGMYHSAASVFHACGVPADRLWGMGIFRHGTYGRTYAHRLADFEKEGECLRHVKEGAFSNKEIITTWTGGVNQEVGDFNVQVLCMDNTTGLAVNSHFPAEAPSSWQLRRNEIRGPVALIAMVQVSVHGWETLLPIDIPQEVIDNESRMAEAKLIAKAVMKEVKTYSEKRDAALLSQSLRI